MMASKLLKSKLRGPGNLMGTQQSGVLNLQIADIVGTEIFVLARKSHKKFLLTMLLRNQNTPP
jgi:RecG-like helicase